MTEILLQYIHVHQEFTFDEINELLNESLLLFLEYIESDFNKRKTHYENQIDFDISYPEHMIHSLVVMPFQNKAKSYSKMEKICDVATCSYEIDFNVKTDSPIKFCKMHSWVREHHQKKHYEAGHRLPIILLVADRTAYNHVDAADNEMKEAFSRILDLVRSSFDTKNEEFLSLTYQETDEFRKEKEGRIFRNRYIDGINGWRWYEAVDDSEAHWKQWPKEEENNLYYRYVSIDEDVYYIWNEWTFQYEKETDEDNALYQYSPVDDNAAIW